MRLGDKVALVTGGGSGIGRGICLRFAEEGAAVAIADINREGAQETARLAAEAAPQARTLVLEADVSRKADCERAVTDTAAALGRLDVFVANAGIGRGGVLTEMLEQDWDDVMAVNLKGVFLSCQAAARRMVEQGQGGKIIVMSSVLSERATPGLSAYAAAKAGIRMATRVWALELAPHGIRINAIGPGLIDTPLVAPLLEMSRLATGRDNNAPLGRAGTPRDVANCALFLATDESDYMTGGIIYPDGGLLSGQLDLGMADTPSPDAAGESS